MGTMGKDNRLTCLLDWLRTFGAEVNEGAWRVVGNCKVHKPLHVLVTTGADGLAAGVRHGGSHEPSEGDSNGDDGRGRLGVYYLIGI